MNEKVKAVDDDRKVALNFRDVPAGLRNRFKGYCSQNEMSMTGAIIKIMEDVVNGGPTRDLLVSSKN